MKDRPRCGAPITTVTQVNVQRVRDVIESDPYVTYDEIEAETFLSRGSIHKIINDELRMKKLASRWIPHHLSEANKIERVKSCKENLALINSNKLRLCDIITGDESWFYHRRIHKKRSNASWVQEGQYARTVVKQGNFEAKNLFTIFFKSTGPILITYLDRGETIKYSSYIENCLKPIVKTLENERPSVGAKSIRIHHDNARPHVHETVNNFLMEQGIKKIRHPPYSPVLLHVIFGYSVILKKD